MSAWLKRFGLHLAAAVGATSIFIGAAAVGAHQTRQQTVTVGPAASPGAGPRRKPTPIVVSPAPSSAAARTPPTPMAGPAGPGPGPGASPRPSQPQRTPTPGKVNPERSLSGTILDVLPDSLDVQGVGGREWRVTPVPGALLRLNGKPVHLDALRAGDAVVILGQAQAPDSQGLRFLAHAITTRRT